MRGAYISQRALQGGGKEKDQTMATLNFCTGCSTNFASSSAHADHRVGSFTPLERRCLTHAELSAKGWTVEVEPVKRRCENSIYVQQMETWHTPVSESARDYFASLRTKRTEADGNNEDEEPEGKIE